MVVLAGCGGGDSPANETPAKSTASANGAQPTSGQPNTAAVPGTTLALDADQPGAIAGEQAYRMGQVAAKAAAVRIPVYRFYNGDTGAHFFTTNTTERDHVQNNLSPPFVYEGVAFSVASAFSPGLSPVHRFFNTRSGVHFYTISEAERANVAANLPQFTYEGVAYHASQVAGAGLLPFHRFFVPSRGFHFFTASEEEKTSIQANLSGVYSYEGIGYHVLANDWRAEKLPHTGITNSQCYETGSNTLVACGGATTTALNPQQDGHRTSGNPMGYSALGTVPVTSCLRDNVTGLIWEGKEATGTRAGSNTYSNNGTNLATDASGYVIHVNGIGLCGFTDWRLPSRQELLTLMDSGRTTAASINTTWFPNTPATSFWSGQGLSTDNALAWYASFMGGSSYSSAAPRTTAYAVRLVRGAGPVGARFTYSTVPYGSDTVNNVVNDAWTGLQWRRCEQGRFWNGSACAGSVSSFTHEQALSHARVQSGWRLPNIKELASLGDLSVTSGARVDPAAFPGAIGAYLWSSSPYAVNSGSAWLVYFNYGSVLAFTRGSGFFVRLVRLPQ
ncbi:DUF1566 domain-containing protein [Hydrogenophaga sp. MI9]|uniref:DUF1566 domain-containing protein n=1 Tax=Hydrogenophaga sp. MI9 TaxID=3453719 RepID=UPI003EEDA792